MMDRIDVPLRWLLSLVMITAGVFHLADPTPFVRIVPAWLPAPLLLVYVSGVAEIAGGVGLAIPRLRRAAAWGLVALYVAVFPANVNQAMHHLQPVSSTVPEWIFWARLPLQALLIAIAWRYTRPARAP